jgi:hypothetical protein
MRARRMVNRVAATTGGSTLKRTQLRDQPRMIEQFTPATVQQRQQVAIQIALGFVGDAVFDAVFAEDLARRGGLRRISPSCRSYYAERNAGQF